MRNFAMIIQYDGTNYSGWQIQPNSITVQQKIEKALFKIFNQTVKIIGSGRTDSGVHANGQVANFRIDSDIKLTLDQLHKALNHNLPQDIRINKVVEVDYDFHSRFSAKFREYKYYLSTKQNVFNRKYEYYCKYPMNIDLLFESAKIFQIRADFTTYSKKNPDLINPTCNIIKCEWNEIQDNRYELTIVSNHFLYGMVRSVVGAMIEISRNRLSSQKVIENIAEKNRDLNSKLSDSKGLFLHKIYFGEKYPQFN